LTWSFGKLLTYRTIGKRPAFRLVSRFYRNGYSALEGCCYRRLVLLVLLLPSLTPFQGKRSGRAFRYSIFKVRFYVSSLIITQKAQLRYFKMNLYFHEENE